MGILVPVEICVIHPILPVEIKSGETFSIFFILKFLLIENEKSSIKTPPDPNRTKMWKKGTSANPVTQKTW